MFRLGLSSPNLSKYAPCSIRILQKVPGFPLLFTGLLYQKPYQAYHTEKSDPNHSKLDYKSQAEFESDANADVQTVFLPDDIKNFRTQATYGTNISDFACRINSNIPTIDKTADMYRLLQQRSSGFLMGPRRFGKTLNLTTFFAIFRNGKDWWYNKCPNFAIVRDFRYDFPQHPVMYLDFSGINDCSGFKRRILLCLKELLIGTLGTKIDSTFLFFIDNLSKFPVAPDKELPTDSQVLAYFETIIKAVTRKEKKGVVVLIDEYDRPITTIAEKLLNGPDEIESLKSHPKILEITDLMKQFYEVLKTLRVQMSLEDINYVRFEYLTGITPISHLGLFPGLNDVFNIRQDKSFDGMLGYTAHDLEETFEDAIKNMARKVVAKNAGVGLDDVHSVNEVDEKMKQTIQEIQANIRKNYSGFRFFPEQKHDLYSPFVINSLFERWVSEPYPDYHPFYANSGSSELIWKAAKMMSLKDKFKFLGALIDDEEEKSHVLFSNFKEEFTMNQTIDQLFFVPEQILFFSGVLSVQKEGSNKDFWNLGIANGEMRRALLYQFEQQLNLNSQTLALGKSLLNEDYDTYLTLINQKLISISAFTEVTKDDGKTEGEVEAYGYTLFGIVHRRLLKFFEQDRIKKDFKIENFGLINNKVCFACKRPDFIVYFHIKRDDGTERKVALIFEFKCKETLNQSLKHAIADLEARIVNIKGGMVKQYEFLEEYDKIWIAAGLGSGQLQGVILHDLKGEGDQKRLVERERWAQLPEVWESLSL